MRRATITLSDELAEAVAAFQRDHPDHAPLEALAETALREYLRRHGYLPARRPLRITPAESGSEDDRGSIDHDRILARRLS